MLMFISSAVIWLCYSDLSKYIWVAWPRCLIRICIRVHNFMQFLYHMIYLVVNKTFMLEETRMTQAWVHDSKFQFLTWEC
jgi:hypothetical protein